MSIWQQPSCTARVLEIEAMGRVCAVSGCNTNSSDHSGISTHIFPSGPPHILRAWVNFVKQTRKNFSKPTKFSSICGLHFPPDAYADQYTASLKAKLGFRQRRVLKEDAVPSLRAEELQQEKPDRRKRAYRREILKKHPPADQNQTCSANDPMGRSSCKRSKTGEEHGDWLSKVTIEMDVAEEPGEGLIHPAFSSGCQGSTVSREHLVLPQKSHGDARCDFKVELDTDETIQHLTSNENVTIDSAARDTSQHPLCANIKAEPTAFQTSVHPPCTNIKAEPTAHEAAQHLRTCEHIKAEPAAHYATQQSLCEHIKAEPMDVQASQHPPWETLKAVPTAHSAGDTVKGEPEVGKDVADCCEPAVESAREKKQAKSLTRNRECESCQRPFPHTTAVLQFLENAGPSPLVSQYSMYLCLLCRSTFQQYSSFQTHMAATHGQKLLAQNAEPSTPDYGRGGPSDGNGEQKADVAGYHVCDVCCEAFTTAETLRTHKLIHAREESSACEVCSKAFNQQNCQVLRFRRSILRP